MIMWTIGIIVYLILALLVVGFIHVGNKNNKL